MSGHVRAISQSLMIHVVETSRSYLKAQAPPPVLDDFGPRGVANEH